MNKILFLLVVITVLPCKADTEGYLTEIIAVQPEVRQIINQQQSNIISPLQYVPLDSLPFTITVQSSDKKGTVIDNNGNEIENIQNVEFDLKDIQQYSFTIPWKGWDGDATVHVRVKKGNELIAQADLQDRDGKIIMIGVKNAKGSSMDKRFGGYKDCPVDVRLRVNSTNGNIYGSLIPCDNAPSLLNWVPTKQQATKK